MFTYVLVMLFSTMNFYHMCIQIFFSIAGIFTHITFEVKFGFVNMKFLVLGKITHFFIGLATFITTKYFIHLHQSLVVLFVLINAMSSIMYRRCNFFLAQITSDFQQITILVYMIFFFVSLAIYSQMKSDPAISTSISLYIRVNCAVVYQFWICWCRFRSEIHFEFPWWLVISSNQFFFNFNFINLFIFHVF